MIAAVAVAGSIVAATLVLVLARDSGTTPRFATEVQPIFDRKCVSCHPVAYPYLDLRRGHAYGELYRVSATTRPAFERVVPGRPELSYLLIHPPDPSNRDLLSDDDVQVISDWIRAGALDN